MSEFSNYGSLSGQSQSFLSTVTISTRCAPLVTLDLDHEVINPVSNVDQVNQKGKFPIGKKHTKDKSITNHNVKQTHNLDHPVDHHVLGVGKKKVDSLLLATTQSNNEFQFACTQLGSGFGAFSFTQLKLYEDPPTDNKPAKDPLKLHKTIRQSGLPNYFGFQIPICSNFNIAKWRDLLHDH